MNKIRQKHCLTMNNLDFFKGHNLIGLIVLCILDRRAL